MHDHLQRECIEAHQAVVQTRTRWLDLYRALDRRTAAHVELEEAKDACRMAAERLNIRTLPINPNALAEMRAAAEAQAHERFKAAREAMKQGQRAPIGKDE